MSCDCDDYGDEEADPVAEARWLALTPEERAAELREWQRLLMASAATTSTISAT